MTTTIEPPADTDRADGQHLHQLMLRVARDAWEQPAQQAEAAGQLLATVVHQLLDYYDAATLAEWINDSDGAAPVHTIRHWDRKYHTVSGTPRAHSKQKRPV